jgi:hypothetical protein
MYPCRPILLVDFDIRTMYEADPGEPKRQVNHQRPRGAEATGSARDHERGMNREVRAVQLASEGEPKRRDPSTFLKKIIFKLLKFFLRHPTEYAVLLATTNGAQTQYLPRGREKLQRYGGGQPKSLELQLLWLSTTTSTVKPTVSDRERLADPGEPDATESRSRTTCRPGRDPSTFLKKIIFRLLKFSNDSTQYSRRLRTVLKHGTPKRARKVATLWW